MGFKEPSGRICATKSVEKNLVLVLLLLPPPMVRVKAGQTGDHCLGVTSQFGGASNPPPPSPTDIVVQVNDYG